MYQTERDFKTDCIWFHGLSGCGKSRLCNEYIQNSGESWYKHPRDGGFWGEYDYQDIVLIDEFKEGRLDFVEILMLTDRYGHKVKVKCESPKEFKSKLILITSFDHPREYFSDLSEEAASIQFTRRVKVQFLRKGHNFDIGKYLLTQKNDTEVVYGNTDIDQEIRGASPDTLAPLAPVTVNIQALPGPTAEI